MLELARLIVDSGWVPSHPVIFLFNGAEELFMLVRHRSNLNSMLKLVFIITSLIILTLFLIISFHVLNGGGNSNMM